MQTVDELAAELGISPDRLRGALAEQAEQAERDGGR